MRDSITIIVLKGHPKSEREKKKLGFWFADHPMVNVQTVTIETNRELKLARKEYKFNDLPCVIYEEAGIKKKECLYSKDFEELTRKLRKKWATVRRL